MALRTLLLIEFLSVKPSTNTKAAFVPFRRIRSGESPNPEHGETSAEVLVYSSINQDTADNDLSN
ncbi:hypothetical protein KEH51_10360 [[Brevibacterium] frigoritolerans]|uniref:Uncharacterized protein n=1 Tax=Peribacillus frigoritolerans TaxID=450367 RepID=A0A941FQ98_9BACI|nr:hypothetical protein [Peribacillus frigoritolerans]